MLTADDLIDRYVIGFRRAGVVPMPAARALALSAVLDELAKSQPTPATVRKLSRDLKDLSCQ